MKKKILLLLVVAMLFTFVACSKSKKVEGTYKDPSENQVIVLADGNAKWTMYGVVFEGTYEVDGVNLKIEMKSSGIVPAFSWTAVIGDKELTITNGVLIGTVLTKQA